MATVQSQPIFNELNNNLVGNQSAMFRRVRRLQPKPGPQVSFAAQNGAGRSHRNTELPGDHLGLSSLSGTWRTQKHQSSFHLVPVEKNRNPADDEYGDGYIKPHQSAPPSCLAPAVAGTIKAAATDSTFAQKPVVVPLD